MKDKIIGMVSCSKHGDFSAIVARDFKGTCPICFREKVGAHSEGNDEQIFLFPEGEIIIKTDTPLTIEKAVCLLETLKYRILKATD